MSQFIHTDVALAKRVYDAFNNIGDVRKEKDFWGFVKGLPSMVVQDGLLQTLSFMKAKADDKKKDKYHKVFTAFENYGKDFWELKMI